jgi:hypothetical protein
MTVEIPTLAAKNAARMGHPVVVEFESEVKV